jgi:hypothetical protein
MDKREILMFQEPENICHQKKAISPSGNSGKSYT